MSLCFMLLSNLDLGIALLFDSVSSIPCVVEVS